MTRSANLALAGVLLLGACAEGAPASSEANTRQRSDAIQGGKDDTTSTFAVAVLDSSGGTCSGTLIAPNLVLTARHCVASDNGGAAVDCARDHFLPANAPSTLRVTTSASASFTTAELHATKVLVPADTLFCGNDIALIIVDKLTTTAVATPAIDPPLTDRTRYGAKLTAIGYGTTGPGATDEGTRRARAGIAINCIPGDATACNAADFDMKPTELAAGSGLCEGDSGSGAYEPTSLAAGKPIVMGVLSRAAENATSCIDAVYGRTDTASAFLISGGKEAAQLGGYPAPAWVDPTAAQVDAGAPDPSNPGGDPGATPPDGGVAGTTTTSGCAIALAGPDGRPGGLALVAVAIAMLVARARRRGR